jgi:voltage-gated potassium channel
MTPTPTAGFGRPYPGFGSPILTPGLAPGPSGAPVQPTAFFPGIFIKKPKQSLASMSYDRFMQTESIAELELEFHRVRRQFLAVGVAAAVVLAAGSVFYHLVEHLGWLDSVYFCTITLTTIGYGDIVPRTDAGKLFTIFYVFIGIGILATFASLLVKNAMARRQYRRSLRKG